MSRRTRASISASFLILLAVVSLWVAPAGASTSDDERALYSATNADRTANGLPSLSYDPAASDVARAWSEQMAASGSLSHNPNLVAEINSRVTTGWTRLGENVGVGWDVAGLERAFMNSPGHRANILGAFNRVGVGTARTGDGRLWVTVVFIQGPAISTVLQVASAPSGAAWYLREALTTGIADVTLSYGMATDRPILCDWDGDGIDTIGVYRDGVFHLRNSLTSGAADVTLTYGMAGDLPACGDWNGDGIDTIGIYRNGVFYLRDTNTTGVADRVAGYGMGGDRPVIGDWNGDGTDTIGVYRNGGFYLRDTNTTGVADRSFIYGNPTDAPIAGDWNGDGTSSIGIVRPG